MEANELHVLRDEIRRVERALREEMRSDRTEAQTNFYFLIKAIVAVVLAIEVLGFAVLVAVGGR